MLLQESARDSCKTGICCTPSCAVKCYAGEICCFDSNGDYYCSSRQN
jgi:hypothetical protein